MLRFCLSALALAAASALLACSSSPATGAGGGGQGGASSSSTGVGLQGGSTSSSGGSAPLTCLEVVTNIPKGACDLLAQNCPPGETCNADNPSNPTTTVCQKNTGLKGAGEKCRADSECRAGLLCVDQCVPVCCTGTNEPCGGGRCSVQLQYGNSLKYVDVCSFDKTCHLLVPDACEPGYECHIEDRTQGLATCTPPSQHSVTEGQSCTFINDCPDMQDCFDANDGQGKICHWYCFLDASRGLPTPGLGGCPLGEVCVAKYGGTDTTVGVPGVGLCFKP
ncbi:MAG TPA: hypothetical protein VHB21_21995 [Minicystis sp.]|nr:hypothetical protein [Minicystis sp.]